MLVTILTTKGSLIDFYMRGIVDNQKSFNIKDKQHTIQNSKSRNCFFSPVHCYLLKHKPERSIYFLKSTSRRNLPKNLEELTRYLK
uniref:Uncharacterized protein n=1 Tax=Strongyloides stercoralis TaxID=6248 RepID=A0A0K0E2X7_STRER